MNPAADRSFGRVSISADWPKRAGGGRLRAARRARHGKNRPPAARLTVACSLLCRREVGCPAGPLCAPSGAGRWVGAGAGRRVGPESVVVRGRCAFGPRGLGRPCAGPSCLRPAGLGAGRHL